MSLLKEAEEVSRLLPQRHVLTDKSIGKIQKVAKQLAEFKMSKKLQYLEQRPYKVVIATTNDKEFKTSYSNLPIEQLTEVVTKLNTKLSDKYSNYESITIVDRATLEKKCFAKHLPEIKQAA